MFVKAIKKVVFVTVFTGAGIIAGLAWRDAQLVGPLNYVQSDQSKAVFAAFEALQAGDREHALELISDPSLELTESCWDLSRGGRFCKALRLTDTLARFAPYGPLGSPTWAGYRDGNMVMNVSYEEVRICVPDDPGFPAIGMVMEGQSSAGIPTGILLDHALELNEVINHSGFRAEELRYRSRDQRLMLARGASVIEMLPADASSGDIFKGALWDYSAARVSYWPRPHGASLRGRLTPPKGAQDGCLSTA